MIDLVDTEFSTTDGIRKRKEGRNIEAEIPVKLVKYNFQDNSLSERFSPLGNEKWVE